jgi:hypothetical protein
MNHEQKIVAIGASSGIVTMLVAMYLLTPIMPALAPGAATAERIAFALRWDALAILPLFAMIVAVGNARALSEAIDPTAGKESRAMLINGRVIDNTVQQYLLFLMATLAVAASDGARMSVVSASAAIFIVVRLAFWIGYRIDPLYRAFGMSSTVYLSVALGIYALSLNL